MSETQKVGVTLKLRPTRVQARTMGRWLWHLTAVYNWSVKTIQHEPIRPSFFDLCARLKGHHRKLGIPVVVLRGTVATARAAWQRHDSGLAGRPKLRGRRRPLNSIVFANPIQRPVNGRVSLPSFGSVRVHRQDIPDGRVCHYARVIRRSSGWYLHLVIDALPAPIPRTDNQEIGIDPGFDRLLTLSNGEVITHPREWTTGQERLGQAQRGHRRKLAARLSERIASRRRDRNHQLSRSLVQRCALIAFSADPLSRQKKSGFGKSVSSAAHAQLRSFLRYKSLAGGTEYIEVPSRKSTKTCSSCGAKTGPTGLAGLSVRQWECVVCGAKHDRDINAAVNTLIAGRGMRHESRRETASGIAI